MLKKPQYTQNKAKNYQNKFSYPPKQPQYFSSNIPGGVEEAIAYNKTSRPN
jgi:hypothetical protein